MAEEGPLAPRGMPIVFTPNPFLINRINVIERGLGLREGKESERKFTCCDVGCGSGRDSVWLAKRGEEVCWW